MQSIISYFKMNIGLHDFAFFQHGRHNRPGVNYRVDINKKELEQELQRRERQEQERRARTAKQKMEEERREKEDQRKKREDQRRDQAVQDELNKLNKRLQAMKASLRQNGAY